MSGELQGKRALITGSSAGIGEATARLFAKEGARVFIHGRNAERTEKVARDLGAPFKTADLKDESEVTALIDAVNSVFGGVDILVNNAGGESTYGASWFEADAEAWARTYNANTISAIRLIRAFVPGMKERGWGRLIQVASGSAHTPQPNVPDYSAAKAGMMSAALSLAKALGRTGVTSNVINPGLIVTLQVTGWLTGLAAQHGWGTEWPEIEKHVAKKVSPTLAGRLGRPEDIARAALFFASPAADYLTGVELRVDGGHA